MAEREGARGGARTDGGEQAGDGEEKGHQRSF